MSETYQFDSKFVHIAAVRQFTQDEIKREPMLFAASPTFAAERGGAITRAFLSRLDAHLPRASFADMIIDSRTHMLMAGWYPCIPGWHHDDVPRTREDGQPDYDAMTYHSQHAMLVCGDASLPEFAIGTTVVSRVPVGRPIYSQWNGEIETEIRGGRLARLPVGENEIVRFDWRGMHRGVPATKAGWRFFIRASWDTARRCENEMRAQVNVYLPAINAGW